MICPNCGKESLYNFCGFCGASLGQTVVPSARIAGLGDRFFALVIDGFFLVGFFVSLGTLIAVRIGAMTDQGFQLQGTPALMLMLSVMMIGFVYVCIGEMVWGRTLGKAFVGTKVQDVTGGDCKAQQVVVRNITKTLDTCSGYWVGLIATVTSNRRQRIGDRLAGTVVVDSPTPRSERLMAVFIFVAVWITNWAASVWIRRIWE